MNKINLANQFVKGVLHLKDNVFLFQEVKKKKFEKLEGSQRMKEKSKLKSSSSLDSTDLSNS